jgi:Holliday junction resolvase RusA-like endonuclease
MYTDDKTASYENLVALAATAALNGAPPLQGPLAVSIVIWLAPPKAASKRQREAMLSGTEPVYGRFDLDNHVKAILDGANTVAFADDRQVVRLRAEKRGGEIPGVDVTITSVLP